MEQSQSFQIIINNDPIIQNPSTKNYTKLIPGVPFPDTFVMNPQFIDKVLIMQEQDANSLMKSKNFNESVWQSRKDRQQTEKEIELLLNRLQLLKKEETLLNKKIEDTRKRTQDVVTKKFNHQLHHEEKSNTKKDDEDRLRMMQMSNLELKRKREQDRLMIREAMKQIKKEEHEELKRLKLENKLSIQSFRTELQQHNRSKKHEIKTLMQQSRSKINLYWQSKIDRIQREHDQVKIENIHAQQKNEGILSRLEEEEMSLITKLQRSQDLHEQMGRRLERAINLPHEEFKKLYDHDRDITIGERKQHTTTTSRLMKPQSDPQLSIIKPVNPLVEDEPAVNRSWLPPPEDEEEEEESHHDKGVGTQEN